MNRFSKLVGAGINALQPYVPGKPVEELERELGISETLKLASNENPLGPSPKGVAAARETIGEINYYPDDIGFRLRNKLARQYALDASNFVLGSGSSDVIDMVARTFLGPGRNAVFSRHAFAMYPIYTTAAGAECRVAQPFPADHPLMPYGHDLEAMSLLVDEQTRVVFLANPNNPTGTWLDAEALYGFIKALPPHVIMVLDEAYIEYVIDREFPNGLAWLQEFPNLIVTRTFSKIYGLAGLRVGYGVAGRELIEIISRVRHPFNVNSPALAAAEAALDDQEFIAASAAMNHQGLLQISRGIETMGLPQIPSAGNFVTFDTGQSGPDVYQRMLREGVIVRPLANYDMPRHLRVTIGTGGENERFLAVLDKVLSE